ncbi:MAG TPA: hypothetical protein PLE45_09935 [Spirochaetota bacterium]|nr:hypothetical protein [Spirochaetota bacterium]HOL57952.1 hypothetical protein [Spirochaetota bacterium]HPP04985.1 hypothetical protein [Spirochaetota bacterium]
MSKKYFIIITILFIAFYLFSDNSSNNISNEEIEKKVEKILKEKIKDYETNNPVFCQKGGMMRTGEHSFYLRTNDEWTGFSTFKLGYRYAVTDYFNIAIEGGASPIPHVYIGALLLHFKIFETKNKFFFLGARFRFGYRYQDSNFNTPEWEPVVGKNYLQLKKHTFYIIPDITASFRFGPYRRFALYYTVFPRFDIDLEGGPTYIFISPVMAGFEVRFGYKMEWSFAIEGGYTFPVPWDSVPAGKWVNFPSLANFGFYYRFGDKFYSKKNIEKMKEEIRKEISP